MLLKRFPDVVVALRDIAGTSVDSRLLPTERALIESARTSRRRAELFAGRLAAVDALEVFSSPRPAVLTDDKGRPKLVPHSRLHISIAHDAGLAVAAVSVHPVGIDVIDLNRLDQTDRVVRHLQPRGNLVSTALLWTAWESLSKQTGKGLRSIARDTEFDRMKQEGAMTTARTGRSVLRWWTEENALLCVSVDQGATTAE